MIWLASWILTISLCWGVMRCIKRELKDLICDAICKGADVVREKFLHIKNE